MEGRQRKTVPRTFLTPILLPPTIKKPRHTFLPWQWTITDPSPLDPAHLPLTLATPRKGKIRRGPTFSTVKVKELGATAQIDNNSIFATNRGGAKISKDVHSLRVTKRYAYVINTTVTIV